MTRSILFLALSLSPPLTALSQTYCSPTFANGCFNWHNQTIQVGSINWAIGSDCTVSDFTTQSTTVNAGDQVPMTVISGVWCGASVWVDFDQSMSFEDSENLFHDYVGGDPGYTYAFTIDIPMGTPAGSYRMRVIGAWGSDGFTPGSMNGWGPCGSFQYGNFTDLTLVVDVGTAVEEADQQGQLVAWPVPTHGPLQVTLDGSFTDRLVTLHTYDGRQLMEQRVPAGVSRTDLDLSDLEPGAYLLRVSGTEARTLRVVKY